MAAEVASEVTADGLKKSLDDLIAAADATEALAKADANGVEHSGHSDERGKVGGGRTSATGKLDPMMIAKMAESGLDASTIADFEAFMVGKMPTEDDDDDDDDDEAKMKAKMAAKMGDHAAGSPPYKKSDDSADDLSKSSLESFREDGDIADSMDVSPFLEALTTRTAEQIDSMRKSLNQGLGSQAGVNRAMALATFEIGKLMKSQSAIINVLGERLGIVEKQPAPAKGATSLTGAEALHKSLKGEVGADGGEPLNKGELCRVLNFMKLEKGENVIAGQNTTEAVCMLEAGGTIAQDVVDAAHRFIAQNPNEAEQARTFH